MKVAIDISILSSGRAFGNVNGTLDFEFAPSIGDTISFAFPKVSNLMPIPGFTGLLRVKDRVINAATGSGIALALEDILVPTNDHAQAVAEFLEKGFGLGVDTY
jgi:hypothetical protein